MITQNFLITVFDLFTTALIFMVFIRIILSWFYQGKNSFTQFIFDVTEPFLGPLRKLNPKNSALDLSPIYLLLLIEAIRFLIGNFL